MHCTLQRCLLHVTGEFHSVMLICRNLYAIFFFRCEKSLYSQSEWRIAVFTCGRITNQRQRKGLCQPIRIVYRLHSNSVSDFGGFFISASFKFSCEGGGKLQICVSWLLPRRVSMALRKQEHIEQITERCLIAHKEFSFKERAERDSKYWCKRCQRVYRQFYAPSA